MSGRGGPLAGLRVLEFAGLGPGPFCAMMLADLGAEVVCVDRPGKGAAAALFEPRKNILNRGRRSVALDLKAAADRDTALALAARADVLIEGFRPGVMERLGLGPDVCLERNPRLVYGRMTGWGQHGPQCDSAGHDINYLAISGALHAIGRRDSGPVPPLNLVADFGGGGMLLAVGLLAALLEARNSGRGQVVDAAMTDGSALLMAMTYSLKAMGRWSGQRQSNILDGGAPFYDTYCCADDKWLALGPIEPQFHHRLLATCGIDEADYGNQWDESAWPRQRALLAEAFSRHPREVWCRRFEGSDACVTPVLDLDEAPEDPHNRARDTFVSHHGLLQPAPAPRFSRTPAALGKPPFEQTGGDNAAVLREWGVPSPD
ncbi:MAG: CoA transferase [Rhodocyclaceae bacterium]|nr:CoA transferase [Rhodocyclaceae bacterium]